MQTNDIDAAYWDLDGDVDALRDWLVDNEFDADADRKLRALQARTASRDDKAAEAAFGRFAAATGMKQDSAWRRFCKVAGAVAAAAFVPLVAVAGIAIASLNSSKVEWNQISTSCGESRNLTLSDGSSIRLGACTKVIYPDRFTGGERKVFVTGEAYLDVAEEADRPFVVTAGDFDVQVHGTRFNIRSYAEDNEDEVALIEGSVSLCFSDSGKTLEMYPGEMVRYSKDDGSVSCRTFSTNYFDEILRSDGLCFDNMQLSDIASILSKRFGKTVIVEDSSIRGERYYASFINNETLEEILSTLNTRNHLSIRIDGDTVRIYRRK